MTVVPLYEVVVTSGGRIEVVTLEATDARAARRAALRICPWADARTQFVGVVARALDFNGRRRVRPIQSGRPVGIARAR